MFDGRDARREWERLEEVLDLALELPADQRSRFIENACGKDEQFLGRVRSLLENADRAADFLERSVDACARGLLEEIAVEVGAGLDDAVPGSLAGRRLGPYRLIRELGRGGMGAVYLAARDDEQYDRRVAIKIVHTGPPGAELTTRFTRERRILAALEHPHIARLYDAGIEGGTPYFVMERVEGRRIDVHCDEQRLGIPERLALFDQVCDAVEHAHRNLIVHRDLKPANILVSGDGVVKLLDFGIAKLIADEPQAATLTGLAPRALTPEYASPEQLRGEPVSTATDVYSLGVLLFELLTGQWPYGSRDRSPVSVERAVLQQEPEKPSAAIRSVGAESGQEAPGRQHGKEPPVTTGRATTRAALHRQLRNGLDSIVLMALSKEPSRRYGSVQQLRDDIRRYLENQPVNARRATWGYRAGRFVRRHRAAVAAAVLVLASILTGLVTAAWQATVAAQQRDVALREADKATRVASFLTDLFFLADPGTSRGRDFTVREAVDSGRVWMERELTRQPELYLEMAHKLGEVYYRLSLYTEAREIWESAVAVGIADGGEISEPVLKVMLLLGKSLEDLGLADSAEVVARRALTIHRRLPQIEDRDFIATHVLVRLANALRLEGRGSEAETVIREALAILPPNHPDASHRRTVLLTMLAHVRRAAGQPAEAESLLREILATRRTVWGDEHPEVAQVLANLGDAIGDQGRYAEAEVLFGQGLEMRRKLQGEGHADFATDLARLAALIRRKGDLGEAERLYGRALELQRTALPPGHPRLAVTLREFGELLLERGRPVAAEPLLHEALVLTAEGKRARATNLARARLDSIRR